MKGMRQDMGNRVYLKKLVEEFHSATVATIGADGRPQTRVIDMMLWDDQGVYFLTAKGKEFYRQVMEQRFLAVSATKDKAAVSLRGKVKNIGSERLDEIFEKQAYMQKIYPGDTREALEVFCVYEAEGEYFDISDPAHVVRDRFVIGDAEAGKTGYFAGEGCIGCKLCYSVCPQKCIDLSAKPVVIDQNRCLHCGRCAEICPKQVIRYTGKERSGRAPAEEQRSPA